MQGDFILDIVFFILIGIAIGTVTGFIPGFSSYNISILLITYGLISTNYYLAITVVALEISHSFFEFLSPIIFGIGNEDTSLAIDNVYDNLKEESFKHDMEIVASGGLIGILVSMPLILFAQKIYPLVYDALKPLVGWILLFLCIYIIYIERSCKQKISAAMIFCLSGSVGLMVRNSGLVSSEFMLIPIFTGLYGFSSLTSKRQKRIDMNKDTTRTEKTKIASIAFLTSMFASLIPGMKRSQTSALSLQIGKVYKRNDVLFVLSLISLAFVTMSIFVLGSTGKVRSNLAYDIQEVMGEFNFQQALLFSGVIAVSACISVCALIFLAKPLGKFLSKINERYLKCLGFLICIFLIINFTGIYGILLAFTTTCIGILSSRLRVRSTHLMGVLLLPTIVWAIL